MIKFNNKWLLFFLLSLGLVYCLIEASGNGDFLIYMWASGELSKHLNIYDHKYLNDYSYYYSVLFAMLLKPFFYLSYYWVKLTWLMVNVGLFFHLAYLLTKTELVQVLHKKQKQLFYFASFVFAFRFFHENIHHAQITILMLWTCIYGLYCIYHQRPIRGAFILAIGINIKLFPIVFLPYLIYRGFFKEVFFVLFFYLGLMFLPSLFIGHDYNISLIKSWWAIINPANTNHILDVDERSFHGLSTLLSTLFVKNVPDLYALPLPRNLFDVSLSVFVKILLVARLLVIGLSMQFLKWPPFKKAKDQFSILMEISYILLAIPLIFPHQQHYAFLFIAPAFSLCVYFMVLNFKNLSLYKRRVFIILLSFSFICSSLKLWLGAFNQYYEHYKILTYGALCLIPLMLWVSSLYKRIES